MTTPYKWAQTGVRLSRVPGVRHAAATEARRIFHNVRERPVRHTQHEFTLSLAACYAVVKVLRLGKVTRVSPARTPLGYVEHRRCWLDPVGESLV
jgi:hypothetical protein